MRKSALLFSAALLAFTHVHAARADDMMLDTPPATGAPVPTVEQTPLPAPAAMPAPVPALPPAEAAKPASAGHSWWSGWRLPHFDLKGRQQNWSTVRCNPGMPMVSSKPLGYDPQLNLSEADAARQFYAMDRDHDGRLSYEEFSSLYASFYPENEDRSQSAKRFAALDADGDGYITLKEFIANRNTEYTTNSTMHWTANGARGTDD